MATPIQTNLRIQNDSKLLGEQQWEWSVWIAGPDEEVGNVNKVTYRLHPTFRNPVQVVRDASTRFKLTASGWGEFAVRADVKLKDGQTVQLERWLELRDEGGRRQTDPTEPGGKRPTVFVSHSVVDMRLVEELRQALAKQGVDTVTADTIDYGLECNVGIENAVGSSDMLVAILSDPPSSFVEQEARAAVRAGRNVLPVVLGGAVVPKPFETLVRFEVKEPQAIGGLADRVVAWAKGHAVAGETAAAEGAPRENTKSSGSLQS